MKEKYYLAKFLQRDIVCNNLEELIKAIHKDYHYVKGMTHFKIYETMRYCKFIPNYNAIVYEE